VIRFTYAAGDAAVEATQRTENALLEAAEILDVTPQDVPETAKRFFDEWKERGKRIDELKEELAAARAGGSGDGEEVEIDSTTAVIQRHDADMDELRATANALVEDGKIAVVGSGAEGAQFVVAVPDCVAVDAGDVVGELASRVGGGGGGPPDFAQGGGPDSEALEAALEAAPDILKQVRNA
jgi:alanyl-tRNA synthetase